MDFQRERVQENKVKKRRICKLKAQEILTGNNGDRYFRCHTNLAGLRGTWRKALWCHSKQDFDQTCQFLCFLCFMSYIIYFVLPVFPWIDFCLSILCTKHGLFDVIHSIYMWYIISYTKKNIWDWCQYNAENRNRPEPESHRSTRTPIPTWPGPLTSGVYACS